MKALTLNRVTSTTKVAMATRAATRSFTSIALTRPGNLAQNRPLAKRNLSLTRRS